MKKFTKEKLMYQRRGGGLNKLFPKKIYTLAVPLSKARKAAASRLAEVDLVFSYTIMYLQKI